MTPLHAIGDFIRGILLVIPLPAVKILFILVPLILLAWVLFLPKEQVVPPGKERGIGSNLKVWAALALLIQVILYAVL